MSKKLILLPALLVGAFLMFIPACTDENLCKDVDCGTYGTCFDGDCVCDDGYEIGTSGKCDTEQRAKFLGTYNSSETCTPPSTGSYSNTITASGSDVTKVVISNFGDSGLNATATIDGYDVTVEPQTFTIGGTTFEITGDGQLNSAGTTITLNYEARTGGAVAFNCTITMNKI